MIPVNQEYTILIQAGQKTYAIRRRLPTHCFSADHVLGEHVLSDVQ